MKQSIQQVQSLQEVSLIGALLFLYGISGTLSGLIKCWQMLLTRHEMASYGFNGLDIQIREISRALAVLWDVLYFPLAIVVLVCGVAVLCHWQWARRVTVMVLAIQIGFHVLSGLFGNFFFEIIPLLRDGSTFQVFTTILFDLFYILLQLSGSVIMLMFMASQRVRDAFGEQHINAGRIEVFAERVLRRLPRTEHPVVSVIALLIICKGLPMLLMFGVSLWHGLRHSSLPYYSFSVSKMAKDAIYPTVSLLTGFGLFSRLPWAVYGALAVFFMGFLSLMPSIMTKISGSDLNSILSFCANMIYNSTQIITLAVMAVYLLKYRNSVQG